MLDTADHDTQIADSSAVRHFLEKIGAQAEAAEGISQDEIDRALITAYHEGLFTGVWVNMPEKDELVLRVILTKYRCRTAAIATLAAQGAHI